MSGSFQPLRPNAPYTCTDTIYREAAALCRRYGVPLVTHLSETEREVEESRQEREVTPYSLRQTGWRVRWQVHRGALRPRNRR
jgi:cytosine/adenosine deaminase-related metal-dependent hydrolase